MCPISSARDHDVAARLKGRAPDTRVQFTAAVLPPHQLATKVRVVPGGTFLDAVAQLMSRTAGSGAKMTKAALTGE